MYDLLVNFCQWLQNTPVALYLASSYYAYPFVQLTHFAGLSLWLGTTLALDFRLLGAGKKLPAADFSDALFFWNWMGLGIALLGGFLLFSMAATGYITNSAFIIKVALILPVAIVWHIIIQRKAHTWGRTQDTPLVAKLAGLVEVVLWLGVATAGVTIPYYE